MIQRLTNIKYVKHTLSRIQSSIGMFASWALIVCEKKQYVLFGRRWSMGTCLTPIITGASLISSWIMAPAFE